MGMERRYSAGQVAAIAMSCSVVVWLAITATAFPEPFPVASLGAQGGRTYYLSLLAIAVAAGIFTYVAIEAFKRGVRNEVWSKPSLDRLLAQLDRSVWKHASLGLVLVAIVYVIVDLATYGSGPHRYHFNGGLIYFWFCPITAYGQLKTTLKPPAPTRGSSSIWLGDMKPLRSDHWGHR
jgi:hypothetical protein